MAPHHAGNLNPVYATAETCSSQRRNCRWVLGVLCALVVAIVAQAWRAWDVAAAATVRSAEAEAHTGTIENDIKWIKNALTRIERRLDERTARANEQPITALEPP
jgi:apolipoprotein N-acyltransferase